MKSICRESLYKQAVLLRFFCLITLVSCLCPENSYAYIGPGAGLALVGSSAVFFIAILFGVVGVLILPFRLCIRFYNSKRNFSEARLKRLIVLGFDGMDPRITETMMANGELPALQKLKEIGGYCRLKSTIPSMSPVAWSTFQTGVNPGSHNVFDFLTRDKRNYLPGMVSVETISSLKRIWFKRRRVSEVVLTRKSKPFWKILGDRGVFSTILRVPISYPPEKLRGNILSAMCTPDIRGSQGTFMFFSSDPARVKAATSGEFVLLDQFEGCFTASIKGPEINSVQSEIKFRIEILEANTAAVFIQQQKILIKLNQFSDWIKLTFEVSGKLVSGLSRFLLKEVSPHISLYVSPVNVDPEAPALPISFPRIFSSWMARTIGSFGTLGFLEDTWGRNENALNDQEFIDQLMLNHAERESMLFEVLARVRRGLCICVFDGTDRIQHMFWRYREANHPAPKENNPKFTRAIEDVYQAMDRVVSKVLSEKRSGDEIIVLSDHGFGSFRRCLNLNFWLMRHGYLVLKPGCSGGNDYLVDVDWSKTRAFALGITGIYVNRVGRERYGIVTELEHSALVKEIAAKLLEIRDPVDDVLAVKKVFLAKEVYRGLYTDEAPDLILGYSDGYRVSWESVTGSIESTLFSDNLKSWSGDHHIYPDDVPGILFTSVKLNKDSPSLIDLAPTILKLFGVRPPAYMEGESLL